jgi:hypothetical protein
MKNNREKAVGDYWGGNNRIFVEMRRREKGMDRSVFLTGVNCFTENIIFWGA